MIVLDHLKPGTTGFSSDIVQVRGVLTKSQGVQKMNIMGVSSRKSMIGFRVLICMDRGVAQAELRRRPNNLKPLQEFKLANTEALGRCLIVLKPYTAMRSHWPAKTIAESGK